MAELLQVHDRLMILETLNRYAWGYDSRDLELLGSTFADSGVFAIELAGTDGWGLIRGAGRSSSGSRASWRSRRINGVTASAIPSSAR